MYCKTQNHSSNCHPGCGRELPGVALTELEPPSGLGSISFFGPAKTPMVASGIFYLANTLMVASGTFYLANTPMVASGIFYLANTLMVASGIFYLASTLMIASGIFTKVKQVNNRIMEKPKNAEIQVLLYPMWQLISKTLLQKILKTLE